MDDLLRPEFVAGGSGGVVFLVMFARLIALVSKLVHSGERSFRNVNRTLAKHRKHMALEEAHQGRVEALLRMVVGARQPGVPGHIVTDPTPLVSMEERR